MVEEHIKHLLRDHDCVIIPDFGGLISHYVPARIQPVKHTLAPPSRRIAFNEKLKVNDGLFISSLAQEHRLPAETARRQVADFVRGLQRELQEKYKYELRGIGLFRLNADGKVAFEFIETENLLDESFGLPELVVRPVLAAPPVKMRNLFQDQPAVTRSGGRKVARSRLTRLYKVAAALVVGGVTFSGLYYLSSQTDYTLSSLNPMSFFVPAGGQQPTDYHSPQASGSAESGHQLSAEEIREMYYELYPSGLTDDLLASKYGGEEVGTASWEEFTGITEEQPQSSEGSANQMAPVEEEASTPATPPADSWAEAENKAPVTAEKPKVAPKETKSSSAPAKPAADKKKSAAVISSETGRYYVIVGGFSTLEKAQVTQKALQKKGRDSKILLPTKGSKLHRVSVADFDTWESASQASNKFKPIYGTTIWVLNY